jgi:hypothetical protein
VERTLTDERLTELLKYSEADTCDFKKNIYSIGDENSKISFLKDILSMANTIRYEPAYIIIGIKQKDGHNEFYDVDANIDENNFISFIKGKIEPELPKLTYYTMRYKKHIIGVFEIGISKYGPFVSKKSYGDKVKAGQVYYRYGSVNSEASETKVKEITNWINRCKYDNFKLISEELELENRDRFNYILLIGEDYLFSRQQYELISNMKWALIVDYTRKTEDSGLYSFFHNDRISIHRIVPGVTIPHFYEGRTLFWCLAPNSNKPGTSDIDRRTWMKLYFSIVNSCISQVLSSLEKKVIFVSLFTGECNNASVENLISINSNTPIFHKHVDISKGTEFYIDNNDTEFVKIQCLGEDICEAFAHNRNLYVNEENYSLIQNESFLVSNTAWIHEEMQPLYINMEKMEASDEIKLNTGLSYFQGREIKWNELNPCIAAERKKYKELIERILETFKRDNSNSELITIDYEAGAGVTTIMKMVAWYFHEEHPVVMLYNYSKDGTRERLRSLSSDVKRRRILLIVDIHDFDIQLMRELVRNLEVDNIPTTILFSRRYMGGGVENYLEEQLKGSEINAFESIYNRQIDLLDIPEKNKELRKETVINIQKENPKSVTPFVYALCAFEDSFVKLSDYIRIHLGKMNDIQKNVLLFISSIHYYTGMEIPMVILQHIIEKEGGKKLERILSKKQSSLLLISGEGVRTLHHCVSGELLKQLCSDGMINEKAWKNNLEVTLMSVIDVFELFQENIKIMRILKALFLNQQPSNKNIDDIEQKHFSYAIEDLPTDIAKKKILVKLCEKIKKNPYVYSNLARYYHYIENNEYSALEYLQYALEVTEDYTFYHLKGIILAKKMRTYIEKNVNEINEDYQAFVRKLNDGLEEVEESYDKSVELNVENIAAFTSKLNYLLSIIRDVQRYICPNMTVNQMLKSEKYLWCNEYISKAYETLEHIQIIDLYMNMDHKDIVVNYESQLLSLEGNISEAISGWNNLLDKRDVYHPIIRRNLIHAYYQQCNKEWNVLEKEKRKYEQVRKLIMDNIQEESDNARNIVQWFDFARNFKGDLSRTIEYFQQYVSNPDIDYYYRAMLAFFAYGLEMEDKTYIKQGIEYSKKCEEEAREKPNRRLLLDVYNSKENNMRKIVKFKKYLDKAERDYNSALALVPKIRGYIKDIEKPEIGWINVEKLDIEVKFNPSYNKARIYRRTKDEGTRVEFVLGFRLEGVFAFSVSDVNDNV